MKVGGKPQMTFVAMLHFPEVKVRVTDVPASREDQLLPQAVPRDSKEYSSISSIHRLYLETVKSTVGLAPSSGCT